MAQKLTDRAVKALKPREKDYRVADGGNLYVLVKATGAKLWRYDCTFQGKRITLSFGEYPTVGLLEAREKHKAAKINLENDRDPRQTESSHLNKPFSYYAIETNTILNLSPNTLKKRLERLNNYVFPVLDRKPIEQITAVDILNICKPVADAGKHETAKLLATYCRQTFDTLLAMQLITNNPAESISRLLPTPKRDTNFAHVTTKEDFLILLNGIKEYKGDFATCKALELLPHVFLRPYNVRFLRWDYIDIEKRLITIPAEEMKMKRPHQVPLSEQALAIIEAMRPVTGKQPYVFMSARSTGKPLSEATLNQAIMRFIHPKTGQPLGRGFMTSHGFRHTSSTMLNELRFDADVIELQLAHLDKDRIRRTYNKADLLKERTVMMQAWSDYLDSLVSGAKVIPINKSIA
ncbi:tyrosine-type recombinase/integrase [Thiosulfativibrio zosterae]|uniref:Integrase n=1 Tax=Thiosulfativibrio zosterae TaxID=2675053 RepID=A0A6F8PR17_9GAMM|nr:integrase arm-type DNA-binding domain-containing protein [Thiosulfativibrio zosterae]BBP44559.1 integrase [Thiosulfativibrio zosterae]